LSIRLTNDRLKSFTEDHIQRLTANNPGGIFTSILTAITSVYNNYFGDLASESVNQAVQEGKTIAMNSARQKLEENISTNEGLISYTYRNDRDKYEEFYPQGLTEYQNADLGAFDIITKRYFEVLEAHAGDFSADFVDEFNTKRGTFVSNRNAQLTAKANVASERSDIATTRPALATQLTKNLLTISLQYLGNETKCAVYFDQTILDASFRESERKITAEINPGETKLIFDNVTKADLQIKIKNTGEEVLNFGFTDAEGNPIALDTHPVAPGQTLTLSAADWGWTSVVKFLNVTNNKDVAGSFVAEKV
jgi:hypothetical protein